MSSHNFEQIRANREFIKEEAKKLEEARKREAKFLNSLKNAENKAYQNVLKAHRNIKHARTNNGNLLTAKSKEEKAIAAWQYASTARSEYIQHLYTTMPHLLNSKKRITLPKSHVERQIVKERRNYVPEITNGRNGENESYYVPVINEENEEEYIGVGGKKRSVVKRTSKKRTTTSTKGKKRTITSKKGKKTTTKSKRGLAMRGGGGSDWLNTVNSRGNVNGTDDHWGVGGAKWFNQFEKSGDYISNSELRRGGYQLQESADQAPKVPSGNDVNALQYQVFGSGADLGTQRA